MPVGYTEMTILLPQQAEPYQLRDNTMKYLLQVYILYAQEYYNRLERLKKLAGLHQFREPTVSHRGEATVDS